MYIKTPVYQTEQIRELENLAAERFGISGQVMMQRAGKAAFDLFLRRWPHAQKVAVLCGSGNNGGDGYIFAQQAQERGVKVTVWQVGNHESSTDDAKHALDSCRKAGVNILSFAEKTDLMHPDVIVDAICGIGIKDNLRSEAVAAIDKMHRAEVPIFAIDVPTGIDADTGRVLGSAVHATVTITFIGHKLGLLTGSGIAYAGEVVSNDLQLPADLFSYVEPVAKKAHLSSYVNYLKPRKRDWHKGLSGHVLVVGGDNGFSGAARMAAMAALRVGAGLVSVATSINNAAVMNANCPEIMCHGVEAAQDLNPLLEKADVVILGPGLGTSDWAKVLWAHVCGTDMPHVLDADALNLLAETTLYSDNWVLTPHPGEAARLLGTSVQAVQSDRLDAVKAINKKYGGVCVLKGAGSLILAPNTLPALCDKGNPGMASAGMGDILSGVIGGLISQGVPLGDAAKLGVCLHAAAGDLAAKDGERGMIATDLLPHLRRLVNS